MGKSIQVSSSQNNNDWEQQTIELLEDQSKTIPVDMTEAINKGQVSRHIRGINSRARNTLTSDFDYAGKINEIDEANARFKKNIVQFCKKNPITTRTMDNLLKQKRIIENGKAYDFILYPLAKGGYGLDTIDNIVINNIDDLVVSVTTGSFGFAIDGVWLNTDDKIFVGNHFSAKNFIFTSELQGCYLYTKYHPETEMTEFYHHRASPNTRAGAARIVELDQEYNTPYSRVYKDKEYLSGVDNSGSSVTWVTPIIYRDISGHWNIFFQKVTYENPVDPINSLKLTHSNHFFATLDYSSTRQRVQTSIKPKSRKSRSIHFERMQNFSNPKIQQQMQLLKIDLKNSSPSFPMLQHNNVSSSQPLISVVTQKYTNGHLQGSFQLLNLLVRKVTGEKFQHSVIANDSLNDSEANLQAGVKQWEELSNKNSSDINYHNGI